MYLTLSDLSSFQRTSRSMRECARDGVIWRHIYSRHQSLCEWLPIERLEKERSVEMTEEGKRKVESYTCTVTLIIKDDADDASVISTTTPTPTPIAMAVNKFNWHDTYKSAVRHHHIVSTLRSRRDLPPRVSHLLLLNQTIFLSLVLLYVLSVQISFYLLQYATNEINGPTRFHSTYSIISIMPNARCIKVIHCIG
jgi:hypothetical protein